MKLKIQYKGDLGSGEVDVVLESEANIKDLIQEFHRKSELRESYTIKGGAPPNRRSIKVSYNYQINNKSTRPLDTSDQVSSLGIVDGDTVLLEIGGGGKVD